MTSPTPVPSFHQKRVLDEIRTYVKERGYAPTYHILAGRLGLRSAATIHEHIGHLQDMGLVSVKPGCGIRSVVMEDE